MLKTEPGMKWHGEGETEPMGNRKLALTITKNGKMDAISWKIIIQRNSQLLYSPPKVWVSVFPSVNRNRILVLSIMKKWKNGRHFAEKRQTAKFPITDPPRFWVSTFSVSTEMEYWRRLFPTSHLCVVLHFLIFLY